MKVWNVKYQNNDIRVENKWDSEKLYINNVLHDEGKGYAYRSKLIGKLPDEKLVKVSIGGWFTAHCTIYVENEKILDE